LAAPRFGINRGSGTAAANNFISLGPQPAGQELYTLFERVEAAIDSCATSLDMIAGRTGERSSHSAQQNILFHLRWPASRGRVDGGANVTLDVAGRLN
jgi:LysR family transcriptional regulator for metE and metH